MRTALSIFAIALTVAASIPAAAEQSGVPIRLIVPYPAGGSADILARTIATPLGPILGKHVIVENRPGAAGALGSSTVARAKSDGNTLLFTNVGPGAIVPAVNTNAGYDPIKDFAAVSLVARSPLLLVTNSALEVKDLKGLMEAAKASPRKFEYSSAGIGSFGHLATELLAQSSNVNLLHVPYLGQAPALMAVVSGEVKMALTAPSATMFEMIRAKKINLMGVSTRVPSALAPGAPPIADVVPNFEAEYWFGVVAPANTSDATLTKLHEGIQKVLEDPAIAVRLGTLGSEVAKASRADFQKLITNEVARWNKVVQAANVKTTN